MQPHVRLKQEHVRFGLEILRRLPVGKDAAQRMALWHLVDRFQDLNYSKKRTITSDVVESHLRSHGYLAPVETDPIKERVVGMNDG